MLVANALDPVSELASTQREYSKAQKENTFAEVLIERSIAGYGDPLAARHQLQMARSQMSHILQKEQFWFELVTQEKNGRKKDWEMIKE